MWIKNIKTTTILASFLFLALSNTAFGMEKNDQDHNSNNPRKGKNPVDANQNNASSSKHSKYQPQGKAQSSDGNRGTSNQKGKKGLNNFSIQTSGTSGEQIFECSSYQEAMEKAMKQIKPETVDQAQNLKITYQRMGEGGRLDKLGGPIGIENAQEGNGAHNFKLRVDFDHTKGPHINVEIGKDNGRQKIAYTYPSRAISDQQNEIKQRVNGMQAVINSSDENSQAKDLFFFLQSNFNRSAVISEKNMVGSSNASINQNHPDNDGSPGTSCSLNVADGTKNSLPRIKTSDWLIAQGFKAGFKPESKHKGKERFDAKEREEDEESADYSERSYEDSNPSENEEQESGEEGSDHTEEEGDEGEEEIEELF